MTRSLLASRLFCTSLLAATVAPLTARAQAAATAPPIIVEAVKHQLEDFHHTAWGLRYRVRRTDSKGTVERDLIESRDGNIARTISRNEQPLSPEADALERKRLESITASDMAKRRRQAESSDKFGVELISALPQAMLFTPVKDAPSLPHAEHAQTVFDFVPNPQYHPSTTSQSALPCIAGRVWIDSETHHLIRIELKVIRNVNLMLGILARVYSGGTLSYEQHPAGGGHYAYTAINIDVKLRELMVKNVPFHSTYTATDITYLPTAPTYQDAVKMLLTKP